MGTVQQRDVTRDERRKRFWEGVFSGWKVRMKDTTRRGTGGRKHRSLIEEFCVMGPMEMGH